MGRLVTAIILSAILTTGTVALLNFTPEQANAINFPANNWSVHANGWNGVLNIDTFDWDDTHEITGTLNFNDGQTHTHISGGIFDQIKGIVPASFLSDLRSFPSPLDSPSSPSSTGQMYIKIIRYLNDGSQQWFFGFMFKDGCHSNCQNANAMSGYFFHYANGQKVSPSYGWYATNGAP